MNDLYGVQLEYHRSSVIESVLHADKWNGRNTSSLFAWTDALPLMLLSQQILMTAAKQLSTVAKSIPLARMAS